MQRTSPTWPDPAQADMYALQARRQIDDALGVKPGQPAAPPRQAVAQPVPVQQQQALLQQRQQQAVMQQRQTPVTPGIANPLLRQLMARYQGGAGGRFQG